MKRFIRVAFTTFVVLAALAIGFEVWRVSEARAKTPILVRDALAHADPEIDRLSPERIAMLLAVEDPTFQTNGGIDLFTPGAGGTTITQGVSKLLYYETYRPGWDEVDVMAVASLALTARASKDEILKVFLSKAYLSHDDKGPIIGFAEGARRWFGRELSDLDDDQFLSLVAMGPAPNSLDPARHGQANADRVARIKRLLAHECTPNGHMDVMLDGCAKPI